MKIFQSLARFPRAALISLLIVSLICLSLAGCLLLAVGGGAAAGGYFLGQKSSDQRQQWPSTTESSEK